ncbi:hypothetical protein GCM10008965_37540 [Methylorubrum aminovorans]|nr:hypothetical protein GCM10025880_09490 [Methylorubrum aminovorans]
MDEMSWSNATDQIGRSPWRQEIYGFEADSWITNEWPSTGSNNIYALALELCHNIPANES